MGRYSMKDYGGIVGVGILVILFIWLTTQLEFPPHIIRGIIFIAVSALLFLVSGAIFNHSWIVGVIVGVIAILMFVLGVNALSNISNNKQALLPLLPMLLSLHK